MPSTHLSPADAYKAEALAKAMAPFTKPAPVLTLEQQAQAFIAHHDRARRIVLAKALESRAARRSMTLGNHLFFSRPSMRSALYHRQCAVKGRARLAALALAEAA